MISRKFQSKCTCVCNRATCKARCTIKSFFVFSWWNIRCFLWQTLENNQLLHLIYFQWILGEIPKSFSHLHSALQALQLALKLWWVKQWGIEILCTVDQLCICAKMAALVVVFLCECRKLQLVACVEIHTQQLQSAAVSLSGFGTFLEPNWFSISINCVYKSIGTLLAFTPKPYFTTLCFTVVR